MKDEEQEILPINPDQDKVDIFDLNAIKEALRSGEIDVPETIARWMSVYFSADEIETIMRAKRAGLNIHEAVVEFRQKFPLQSRGKGFYRALGDVITEILKTREVNDENTDPR